MTSIVASEVLTNLSSGTSLDSGVEEASDGEDEFLPPPSSWFDDNSSSTKVAGDTTLESSSPMHSDDNLGNTLESGSRESLPITDLSPPRPGPVGQTLPSPSWQEISSQILPCAARELLTSSMQRIHHTARLSYSRARWQRKYSELGNNMGGYFRFEDPTGEQHGWEAPKELPELPPFSSLPWVDRQMVSEWRTYLEDEQKEDQNKQSSEELDFDRARTLVPTPASRPAWQLAEVCFSCHKTFGPTRLRHHCRLCGQSFCQAHSSESHQLPHLGYDPDVAERVCDSCKRLLLEHNLAERVAWRLARCRDHSQGKLTPYFETGVDTMEQIAKRITEAALTAARSIPLGAQATVAVETVDVLRKYGLNGIYTIMLRKEFLAAADLLRKALGINRTAWPLSVHELSAAIFYALAQHRAMRGLHPEREHLIHAFRQPYTAETGLAPIGKESEEGTERLYSKEAGRISNLVSDKDDDTGSNIENIDTEDASFIPVCDPVPDDELKALIFYAPLALNFIYAEKEVDMQLLAAQQGWRLLYAYLTPQGTHPGYDLPASALFIHDEEKVLCLSCRGTATISDVVTDLRQVAVSFPEADVNLEDEWTKVRGGQGVAVCGMSNAALNLYQEHIDVILYYAKRGYRIRLTGHSLGGGVSALLGLLVQRDLLKNSLIDSIPEQGNVEAEDDAYLKVYAYGTPSCVDCSLATFLESFVTSVVLHDDVVPRLTPVSCRGLLKYLLHIRETWVKEHLPGDIQAITDRAKSAWAPRWRGSFTLPTSSSSIKRYCRKQIQNGKNKLQSVKEKILCDDWGQLSTISANGKECEDQEFEPNAKHSEECNAPQALVLEFMGGLDCKSAAGLMIDGDEFFDPGESLLEEENAELLVSSLDQEVAERETATMEGQLDNLTIQEVQNAPAENDEEDTEARGAVVLEETPLPRMFQPGRIVHIYSHRGVYRAAFVPRDFRELRRISLAGNMLSDHKAKPYYESLLEVRSVRRAKEAPPIWTAFDEDDTW